MLMRIRRREHNTPVLKPQHWLPLRFRTDFKILLLVFKCLNGLAYLSDLLLSYQACRLSEKLRAVETVGIFKKEAWD